MPTAYIEKLAKQGKYGTLDELEAKWKEAGDIANAEGAKDPDIVVSYAYITSIFQNLVGIKASQASVVAAVLLEAQTAYIKKLARDGKHGSLKELEKKWKEAKAICNSGSIRAYPYLVSVFQNLIGIRKTAPKGAK